MKLIYSFLLCTISFISYSQKSIIEQPQPQEVNLSINKEKTVIYLRKAGNSLMSGVAMAALGILIYNYGQGTSRKAAGTILQVGGGAALFHSGWSLWKASNYQEKSLKEISLKDTMANK